MTKQEASNNKKYSNPTEAFLNLDLNASEWRIIAAYLVGIFGCEPIKKTVAFANGDVERILGVERIALEDLERYVVNIMSQTVEWHFQNKKGYALLKLFSTEIGSKKNSEYCYLSITATDSFREEIIQKENLLDLICSVFDIIRKKEQDTVAKDWVPVEKGLPESDINPVTRDAYEYPVTVDFGDVTDVRYYSFWEGHWYNNSPFPVDKYVTAWMDRPQPYKAEACAGETAKNTGKKPAYWRDRTQFNDFSFVECSACGYRTENFRAINWMYCPNCGCKMTKKGETYEDR